MLLSAARTVGLAEKMPEKNRGHDIIAFDARLYAENDLTTLMATGKVSRRDEIGGPFVARGGSNGADHDAGWGTAGRRAMRRLVVVGDSDFCGQRPVEHQGQFQFSAQHAGVAERERELELRNPGHGQAGTRR